MGSRSTLWAVVALTIMVGALGYSLGRDAAAMIDRATVMRVPFVALPP